MAWRLPFRANSSTLWFLQVAGRPSEPIRAASIGLEISVIIGVGLRALLAEARRTIGVFMPGISCGALNGAALPCGTSGKAAVPIGTFVGVPPANGSGFMALAAMAARR